MDIKNISRFALLFFLIAWVNCQEGESNNVTSAEESTADVIKTIQKRQSGPDTQDEAPQQPTSGLNSGLLQVLSNLLNSQSGLSPQSVDSAINLFTVNSVKQDLVLFRRSLNLVARFAVFLNKYLPTSQGNDLNSTSPQLLSSKIRFYSTNPESYQWFNSNNGDSSVPPHIQTLVDYATEQEGSSSTTAAPDVEIQPEDILATERAQILFTENNPVSTSSTILETPAAIIINTSATTTTSTTTAEIIDVQNRFQSGQNLNVTASNSLATGNRTNNFNLDRPNASQINGFYGLPIDGYGLPFSSREQIFNKYSRVNQDNDKAFLELPHYIKNIPFSQLPSNTARNFGSVADIPLEYPTFSDNATGNLHDSFGVPVNNKFGSNYKRPNAPYFSSK